MAPYEALGSGRSSQGKYGIAGCQTAMPRTCDGGQRVGWNAQRWQSLSASAAAWAVIVSEGYDRNPKTALRFAQQSKQIEQEKKDNFKQADDLMKQADKAESKRGGNRSERPRIALQVHQQQAGAAHREARPLNQEPVANMKKVGPILRITPPS